MCLSFQARDKEIFLDSNVISGESWKGTMSLGKGGFALAGLSEYKSPEDECYRPLILQAVVKKMTYVNLRFSMASYEIA